jgi:hypothetical protein
MASKVQLDPEKVRRALASNTLKAPKQNQNGRKKQKSRDQSIDPLASIENLNSYST